jgi:NADPH:quinone reductase-like Zn-dependent oxidoreductase
MTTAIGQPMHAVAIDGFGGLDVLRYREMPRPEPKAGEVLIRVRAAGVGIWDVYNRDGSFGTKAPVFPLILGAECAGVIAGIGANVPGDVHEGDEVYTYLHGEQGAYAQYVAVKAEFVALKPTNLSFVEAAAVPVDAITAHQALVDALDVEPAEIVAIAGASGGVGTMAVQIAARVLRARVIATTSTRNRAYVQQLGAHEVVDYTTGDVVAGIKQIVSGGVDAALDCVGKEDDAKKLIAAVRPGGRLAELVGEEVSAERGIRIFHIESQPSGLRLRHIAAMIESGKIRVEVERAFTLMQAREAQEFVESRRTRGKIVLTVD